MNADGINSTLQEPNQAPQTVEYVSPLFAWLTFLVAVMGASLLHLLLFGVVFALFSFNVMEPLDNPAFYAALFAIALLPGNLIARAANHLAHWRGRSLVFLGLFQPVVLIIMITTLATEKDGVYYVSSAGYITAIFMILKHYGAGR